MRTGHDVFTDGIFGIRQVNRIFRFTSRKVSKNKMYKGICYLVLFFLLCLVYAYEEAALLRVQMRLRDVIFSEDTENIVRFILHFSRLVRVLQMRCL